MDSSTPWMAASDGDLALLQASLAKLNLTPATAMDENGYTLLQAAASYGQIPTMQWLVVQQQVNVNAVDQEGDSALHYASTVAAAQFLIEIAKIDVHHRNQAGKNALQSKQEELNEMLDDEDNDDQDADFVNLKAVVEYLTSIQNSMTTEQ